ncbi:TasA family protein [Alkalibaculum sporogenes]|nr:TasA family protein [Alkalibaculum sporogenes]
MKKNITILVSSVLVIALVIGGATMAWFTSGAEANNVFTTGSVDITLNDEFPLDGIQNVNPGDWYQKDVSVTSNGSKQTYVRVRFTPEWTSAQERVSLPINNIVPDLNTDDWVRVGNWFYYKEILNQEETTELLLSGITFDGKKTDNRYKGATFEIDIEVQAVQASHYAFQDEWGITGVMGTNGFIPAVGVEEWTPENEAPTN